MNRRKFLGWAAALGTLGLAAAYPVFGARYMVMTNRYRIPVPNLPDAFNGFTIAHLTDLHYGFLVPLAFIEFIVQKTNRLQADLVICSGDYVHKRNTCSEIDLVWPVLGRLKAAHGVWSVLGNHDHWADTGRSQYWLDKTGQNLNRKVRPVTRGSQRVWLAGAGDLWKDHVPLDNLLEDIPEKECRIVIAHNPDSADTDHTGRVDLFICGHTHGGQVSIPFVGPPVLPVQNKSYAGGLAYSPKKEAVFISRGIGWAIYPVRLNCPPEIAVLELVRS